MKENKKATLYLIVLVIAIASIAFRLLGDNSLEQTSLLFIGIPTLITILIIRYSKKPKSAYGVAFLTITIFLLISGIFLGEGFVCILFMAPLFYAVTAVLVWGYEYLDKKDKNKTYSLITIPLFLVLFNPLDYVGEEKTHSIETVKQIDTKLNISTLNKHPDFLSKLPTFFKIGFPKPIHSKGEGLAIGDTRTIDFKSSTKGVGQLVLEIKERTENTIYFKIKSDNTHINHWLTYKEIKVEVRERAGIKEVVWTTDFVCDLGPSWYFEAFEKYAINLMNEHLIQSYFTVK